MTKTDEIEADFDGSEEVENEPEKQRFRVIFGSLPLFGDLYMGMQAMNLDIVDQILEVEEQKLLREYIDLERTPVPQALLVSAISQLWIFGLYELLRTWRQRVDEVIRFAAAVRGLTGPARTQQISRKRRAIRKSSKHALESRWSNFSRALRSAKFLRELENAYDRTEIVFRRIEALRVSLAKHEIPKSKGTFAMAPGYGRIDGSDGSIYWQIVLRGNEVDIVSRQAIASQCRAISNDFSKFVLPRNIQKQLAGFPHHSYGTKRTRVTLRDKRVFDGVLVAWDKQVVFVERQSEMPFDAGDVIKVESRPRKIRRPPQ